jgi:hypothetical protein
MNKLTDLQDKMEAKFFEAEKLRDKAQTLDEKATELGYEYVKLLAKLIMSENPNVSEFVMAMGACFFTYMDYDYGDEGEEAEGIERTVGTNFKFGNDKHFPEWAEPMIDFISKWDSALHITGYSVRIDRSGNEVTIW